jgi:secreted trypsin-like serine protease
MKLLERAAATAVALTAGSTALLFGAGPAAAIVGGQTALRTYPGMSFVMVDFGDEGVAGCNGVLTAPPGIPAPSVKIGVSRWLLTASHCITWDNVAPASVPVAPAAITVHTGSIDRTKGQTAVGETVYPQPNWAWGVTTTTGTGVSDVALVKLDHAIRGPVMQIAAAQTAVGHSARLAGWGLTDWPVGDDVPLPTTLHQKTVTQLPASACAGTVIGVGDICMSGGACYGDSGGPAMVYRFGQWQQIGLGSRESVEGDDACTAPTVYTDTVSFADWIRDTMRSGRPQPPAVTPNRTLSSQDQATMQQLKNSRTWLTGGSR